MINLKCTLVASLATFSMATFSFAEPLHVKGSSTVFPFAMMSADAFTESHREFEYPNVESGGSSKGLKAFCEGVGPDTLDIATASRKIKAKEVAACAENGVTDIIEVRIGYDGLVFANNRKGEQFALTPADIFQALGTQVLIDGQLQANPSQAWNDVNEALPAQAIRMFIPTSDHGTREVFDKTVIVAGCKSTGAYDAFVTSNGGDAKAAVSSCMALRTDDAVTELAVVGIEVLEKIRGTNGAIGLLGLAFYESNLGDVQAASISGVLPSSSTIASGEYPVSRPLFMYVKKANIGVTPGIKEYVLSVLSDEMSGPNGFLTHFGLVSDPELQTTRDLVAAEVPMAAGS